MHISSFIGSSHRWSNPSSTALVFVSYDIGTPYGRALWPLNPKDFQHPILELHNQRFAFQIPACWSSQLGAHFADDVILFGVNLAIIRLSTGLLEPSGEKRFIFGAPCDHSPEGGLPGSACASNDPLPVVRIKVAVTNEAVRGGIREMLR
jgi:hypothetical protein